MFGRRKSAAEHEGAIALDGLDFLGNSREFARLWAEPGGPMTALIVPQNLGADPFLFGMAMVDAARHAARAWSQAVGISEEDALARILEGFDAERGHHTTDLQNPPAEGSSH